MIVILYVIMGGSASGKDSIINVLKKEHGYKVCVSSTTRPKRENEIQGRDYNFISTAEFLQKLQKGDFLEFRKYETVEGLWLYGLDKKDVDLTKKQLVILDAKGYETVINKLGKENVTGIYIYANEREKLYRSLNREPNRDDKSYYLELYRRMMDDLNAFNLVEADDNVYKVKNENGKFDETINEILQIIKLQERR